MQISRHRLNYKMHSKISSVTVGNIDFDDINMERSYSPWNGYSRSKLANVLFTREFARRLKGELNEKRFHDKMQ